MKHVVGLSSAKGQGRRWLLDVENRMRFDTDHYETLGYFGLLAPAFERYAQRDADTGIWAINVMFTLGGEDLADSLSILRRLQREVEERPDRWKQLLGTVRLQGAQVQQIEALLLRRRVMALIKMLSALVQRAIDEEKLVVYGNGVCYRLLCGIKLPPGVVEYS